MESTRNFKIRKTGKTKSFAETLEMEEVANLNDLRIA